MMHKSSQKLFLSTAGMLSLVDGGEGGDKDAWGLYLLRKMNRNWSG